MPEMSEGAIHELAQYRVIAATPAEAQRKVAELKKDNQKERDKVRDLTEKLKAVPPEGAVVLAGEEATAYAAWKTALEGMKPEDVAKLKSDNATLTADKAKRDRKDLLAAARETEGWNDSAPDVLMALEGFNALDLTQGDVTVERTNGGKKESVKAKTAFVTVDGKPVRISDWVKEAQPVIATILTAQTSGNGSGTSASVAAPEQRGHSTGGVTQRTAEDHQKAVTSRVDYSV